jgi:methyltransferase (TIGR00027 family)
MKAGQGSQTAVWVCMARAYAHGRTIDKFSDPTALALLPDEAREKIEKLRAGTPLEDPAERMMLEGRTAMMIARTVEIDDAIRSAAHPQVVILGAGLDGRAWRMPELRDARVFEVDHPDSQRDKRARLSGLTQLARDVSFVAVDFTRDSLGDALAAAGHDPAQPTTWIWEGVVMYLTLADIEATLAVIAARSAPGSTLVVAYIQPSPLVPMIDAVVRKAGEPFQSAFSADEMRALLARYGFDVTRDVDVPTIGAALSPDLGARTQHVSHARIATAARIA